MTAQDTTTQLWGGETTKAVGNFPVSGERVPVQVVRWLGHLGAERRMSDKTLDAYRRDVHQFLAFMAGYQPPLPTTVSQTRCVPTIK